ncbi:MAG TPA: CHAT domain-containing tetratricopeptide repeat protein [Candidatus Methylomirabilis sp.]|nr:CHAT domain-containing tetratricopeptide repeat protein [Candidatus Methylomirabilis sp.]
MLRFITSVAFGVFLALFIATPSAAQGADQLRRARELNAEVRRHLQEGSYREGIPKGREALAIREKALGPNHPDVATSLFNLAWLLLENGDYPEAKTLFTRALQIREQSLGPNSPEVAATLNGLGHLLYLTGDYAAARPLNERALTIREQILGPTHPAVAQSLHNMGLVLHHGLGDFAGARSLHERALQIREQSLGPTHPAVAQSLSHLADVLRDTGNYAAARPLYERALQIREQERGSSHASVASTLNSLARLHYATGDFAGARRLYERALQIREQSLGPTHPAVAQSLNALAHLHRTSRNYAAARPLYERALQIREQVLGATHPGVGWSLNGLGWLLWSMRDDRSARPVFERTLVIARTADAPELRWRSALGLGRVHERQGRPLEAIAMYQEAMRTVEKQAGQFGEEESRTTYLQAENRLAVYDALARLLLKLHEQDSSKGYDREAFAVLEARKGRIVAEALGAARPRLQDPKAREEAEKAQAKQDRVLALEEALREEQAKAPKEQQSEKVQNLTALLAQTKAEYLAQVQAFLARYPQYKSQFVDQQTVDPKLLAKFADRLPAGTMAVQYFASPDALYIFVVAPGGRFQVKSQAVSQTELYELIKQYRQHVERGASQPLPWADDGSETYRRDVASLKELTQKLASHLLGPIEAELKSTRNLVLIPNDLLLYLPIHALTRAQPDGSVRFLAETHAISTLTQLELVDLLTPVQPAANTPLLAIANPDGTLPGASREVRALQRARPAVTALEGPQATKAQFLSMVGQFPDLHLATHGILDPERPDRSYLLMAGPEEAGQRLGIAEIAGLSLRNGLTILSACETAVGEQVPGAALITLAAAFSQAGAQSIVASLWKVNDASTRDFMVAFHRAVGATGRAAAFQQAQIAVLSNPHTAHPYYWAPFILIGAR